MAFLKWCGRVLLWVIFLPVGLWRSWRHGANKHTERLEVAIRESKRPAK